MNHRPRISTADIVTIRIAAKLGVPHRAIQRHTAVPMTTVYMIATEQRHADIAHPVLSIYEDAPRVHW